LKRSLPWILALCCCVLLWSCHREPTAGGESEAGGKLPEPPPPLDGARLIHEHSCLRCHTWEGVRILEPGPALDHAGDKLRPEWIERFLEDPSVSRMPVIAGLDAATRTELVSFLSGLRRETAFPAALEGDAARGAALYAAKECAKCHNPKRPELVLDDAAGKLRRDWLVAYLQDPPGAFPGAQMPSFDLSAQDAADLAAHLLEGASPFEAVPASNAGLDAYVRLQCISCHPLPHLAGKPMQELLTGDRAFVPHLEKTEGVPRIEVTGQELLAMRHVLGQWTAPQEGGIAELAETTTRDYWRRPVPAQGEPPAHWSGLERSLHPAACGTCHPRQHYDWKDSLHARAFSYGFIADTLFADDGSCLNCHTPLREQWDDAALRSTGINCASCHLRSHARHAPQLAEHDLLESRRDGVHDGARRHDYLSSSEFCKHCHQFKPGESVMLERGLLMTTYDEWEGSPAAAEGKTCQSCHMPGRRHLWRGIHDPDMVREYLDVELEGRSIVLTNRAGHRTPTYTIPRINVTAWLEDASGNEVGDTRRQWIIQRKVRFENRPTDRDLFDTRLEPGERRVYDYDGPQLDGTTLTVSVDVEPDEHYRWLYGTRLELTTLTEEMEQYYRLALDYPLAEPFNVTVVRAPAD
jgi:mono/diheme cytochrome c family protein